MPWTNFLRLCSTTFRRGLSTTKIWSFSVPQKAKIATPVSETIKDIIMYRYENPRFFNILNFFAISQFGFWAFMSTSTFALLDTPVEETKETAIATTPNKSEDDVPFWRKINLGADKYRYGMAIGCFLMGYGILFFSWTYTMRSIRFLILRKDRKTVSFVTYGPFGKNRIMDVPVNCTSAAGSRSGGTTQMPVKVKGKWFFYILDLKEGQFTQPKLFDQTVGLQRSFAK